MVTYTCAFVERIRAELALMTTDCKGVTALEYGLLAGLIAVVVAVGAGTLGTSIKGMFTAIGSSI